MTVGNQALKRRDEPRLLSDVIAEDAERVKTVRDAAGHDAELFIDANCSLDLFHARALCQMIEPYHIEFFEEPITQNDVRQMADLRSQTSIRLACGQNEAQAYRFSGYADLWCGRYYPAKCGDNGWLYPVPENRRTCRQLQYLCR